MTAATALRLNAAFSLATGLLLTVAPEKVGDWLGVSVDGWLRALGIVLIGHAVLLIWASRQTAINSWTRLNIGAIAPYPLVMVGLVATGLVEDTLGQALLLLDGTIVGALAFLQWTGLRTAAGETHPVAA